jgi:hypothetical protein
VANYFWIIYSLTLDKKLMGCNFCVPKKIFNKIGVFKQCGLEDEKINHESKKEGKRIFLKDRRVQKYGIIGICLHYHELRLIDAGYIKQTN